MQRAIVSDVHANLHALEAVLDDLDQRGIEEIWCLGDTVGYGAYPNECTALVQERCDVMLAGNHDLVICGSLSLSEFSADAADAARWTKDRIDPQHAKLLRSLSPYRPGPQYGLYHASPRDPVWEYVLSVDQADACLRQQPRRVSLIGHSHVALYFSRSAGKPTAGAVADPGLGLDPRDGKWLLNPGSVGQPRDGDPRASYLLLDTESGQAEWHRVEYAIDEAAAAIIDAGLPVRLGERLFLGR